MASPTRSHAEPQRAAKKSKPRGGQSGRSQGNKKRPRVPCPECGEPQAKGAGLASHMRAKHPPAAEPVEEPPVAVVGSDDAGQVSDRVVPVPPDGLGEAQSIWRSIVNVYDLRPDELRILEDACREAQLIDRLEREISSQYAPLIVKGSMGQPVANPLVSEIRQHRMALAGLFRKLELPDDNVSGESPAERSVKARAAANARWRRGT